MNSQRVGRLGLRERMTIICVLHSLTPLASVVYKELVLILANTTEGEV
jgi:hypothetical protein